MKAYRVKRWHEDGSKSFREFDTIEMAMEFYESLDGLAEVQRYNEERHGYEAVVYPEFGF